MAMKKKLIAEVSRAREELEQEGRIIVKAPLLVWGAECGIRFFLAAVLSGAQIFGSYTPFGVALVGASGSGLGGLFALVGAVLGYLAFQGFVDGLRYVAAAVLTFSVSFAFFDVKVYRKSWFMPFITALFTGATGFVYLADQGWLASDVIYFVTEILFAGAGVYFYRTAFASWQEEDAPAPQRTASFLILGGTALLTLAQISMPFGLSLGRTLAALGVMMISYTGGPGTGAAVGITAGLTMDLAAGGGAYFSMVYALAGLMTGIFKKQTRLSAALCYVLTNATAVLWTWEHGANIPILYEVFIASVVFLLLPESALRRAGSLFPRAEASITGEHARKYVAHRLEGTANAFKELYESLRGAFQPSKSNDGNIASVFDRAASRVCRSCALRDNCWQRDYITTFNALNDASQAILDRGRGLPGDFPSHFSNRCLHFPAFLAAANEELTALLCRSQYQNRLRESRLAVCRQYAQVGSLLKQAAADLENEPAPDPLRERKLRQHMAVLGLEGQVAVFYDENGHIRVELPDLPPLRDEKEQKKIAALLGIPLLPPEQIGGRLVFIQAEPLVAVAGLAAKRKEGETVSGDTGAWFRRENGGLFLLLCDGMGSGQEAGEESRRSIRLLERFLRAGVEPSAALVTLNAALALRGEEDGGFTTIDLMELDLFSGQGAVYKFGAAPTYLRKKDAVHRVTGSALPAGLTAGDEVSPDISRFSLEAGDWVVLVSDGVTAGEEDEWLREALLSFTGDSPKELARALIEGSVGREGGADDRTAMVLHLTSRTENV